jgi:hypothetical protein
MKYFSCLFYYQIRFWNIKISKRSKIDSNTKAKFFYKTNIRFIFIWHLGLFLLPKMLSYWPNFWQTNPLFFRYRQQTISSANMQDNCFILLKSKTRQVTIKDFLFVYCTISRGNFTMFCGILVRKHCFRIIMLMQHLGRLLDTRTSAK